MEVVLSLFACWWHIKIEGENKLQSLDHGFSSSLDPYKFTFWSSYIKRTRQRERIIRQGWLSCTRELNLQSETHQVRETRTERKAIWGQK